MRALRFLRASSGGARLLLGCLVEMPHPPSGSAGYFGDATEFIMSQAISASRAVPMKASVFGKMAGAYSQWRSRRRAYESLERLSDRELDDIGISRYEVRDILRPHGR